MKYYFFNFKTNNVGYHLDLEDFLADKKDLEKGVQQLNTVLNSPDRQKIIDNLKNNLNKQLEVFIWMEI